MIELKHSDVAFDETTHTYTRGAEKLSGITSLIHSVLRLGVYPKADEETIEVRIPRAGYYGKCVHEAIRMFNDTGIDVTEFPEKEHQTKHYGLQIFPGHDVSEELENYKLMLTNGRKNIASEFTVSFGQYASQIDAVWEESDGVYLVDYKTNNLDYYPGKAAGLKQYLSWQLSCYAMMFEQQTGIKVKGLYGIWLRHDEKALWQIDRQPDEQVMCLLKTVAIPKEDGTFVYLNSEMQVEETTEVVATAQDIAAPANIIKAVADLLRAEKAAKDMKERLRELMEQNGVTKFECDEFTATIGKPSVSTSFDSKAFKKDHADLFGQYTREISKKGSFTLKLK